MPGSQHAAMNLRAMTPVAPQAMARSQDRAASAYARHLLQSPGSPTRRQGCMSAQPQFEPKPSPVKYASSLRFRPNINVKDSAMAEQEDEGCADDGEFGVQHQVEINDSRHPSQPKQRQQTIHDDGQRSGALSSVRSQPRLAYGSPQEVSSITNPSASQIRRPINDPLKTDRSQPVQSPQPIRAVTPLRTVPNRILGGQSNGRGSTLRGAMLPTVPEPVTYINVMGQMNDNNQMDGGAFAFRSRLPTRDKNVRNLSQPNIAAPVAQVAISQGDYYQDTEIDDELFR